MLNKVLRWSLVTYMCSITCDMNYSRLTQFVWFEPEFFLALNSESKERIRVLNFLRILTMECCTNTSSNYTYINGLGSHQPTKDIGREAIRLDDSMLQRSRFCNKHSLEIFSMHIFGSVL